VTLAVAQTGTQVLIDSSGASSTISYGSLPAIGSGGGLEYITTTADPTITDNQAHGSGSPAGWQKARSGTDPVASQLAGAYFLPRVKTSAGTFTVTVTHSTSGAFALMNLVEVSSTVGGGIVLDKQSSATVTTGTPLATSVDTTGSDANQFLMSVMTVDSSTANNNITGGITSGTQLMVSQDSSTHIAGAGDYRVVSVTGSYSASYALPNAHSAAVVVMISFKEGTAPIVNVSMTKEKATKFPLRTVFRRPRLIAVSSPTSVDLQFPLDEDPYDENGSMKGGLRDGIDWNDMEAGAADSVRCCFASVTSGNDSICHIAAGRHAIANDHEVVSTVRRKVGYTAIDSHEILLLLRFSISANNARGYECLISFDGSGQIVRWDGPLNGFVILTPTGSNFPGALVDGDKVRAKIAGSVITVFYTPVSTGIESQVLTVTDATWPSGNPGFGNFVRTNTGQTPSSYCHKRVILRNAT
jgi:hypothetical protein